MSEELSNRYSEAFEDDDTVIPQAATSGGTSGTEAAASLYADDDPKLALIGYGVNGVYGNRANAVAPLGHPAFITYSFADTLPAGASTSDYPGFRALTSDEKAAIRQALDTWQKVSGVVFLEAPDGQGEVQFDTYNFTGTSESAAAAYTAKTFSSSVAPVVAEIAFNTGGKASQDLRLGDGVLTAVHEIGHALGFKHSGNYNASGGGASPPYLSSSMDNTTNTVMSYYFSSGVTGLGPVDIAAVQYFYGDSQSLAQSGITYSWDSSKLVLTQTGTSGDDVLIGTNLQDVFKPLGGNDSVYGYGSMDTVVYGVASSQATITRSGTTVTVTAAQGGTDTLHSIESLQFTDGTVSLVVTSTALAGGGKQITGTLFDDTIYGSSSADNINGGAGNDFIYGNGGADTLTGGAGNDTINAFGGAYIDGGDGNDNIAEISSGAFAPVTVFGGAGDDIITALADGSRADGGDGNDTLQSNGNALLIGGAGNDTIHGVLNHVTTAVYDTNSDQAVYGKAGNGAITITTPNDGTDTVGDVQYAAFNDRLVQLADIATGGAVSLPVSGSVSVASLFSIKLLGGGTLSSLRVYDIGSGSLRLDGVTQTYGTLYTWDQFQRLQFVAGASPASDILSVSAFDGTTSISPQAQVTTVANGPYIMSGRVDGGVVDGSAAAVRYTVTFNENVTGVSADDFHTLTTGTAGGVVTAVQGQGATYTVTVGGLTGMGTLRLGLNDTRTGIVDAAGAALSANAMNADSVTVNRPAFVWTDTVTGQAQASSGLMAYTGPVTYLKSQKIWSGSDGVALAANGPSAFLKGGDGDDALAVSAGSNVLDGGRGSNFLVGSTAQDGGADTFFIDGRGGQTTWGTVVNFRAGDAVTIWGYTDASVANWAASEGATGFQGATLHAALAGAGTAVNASVTFSGLSLDDIKNHVTQSVGQVGDASYLYLSYHG
ncbi:matrixin family metalloprotease [Nitrospirillum iridis]|uniref:Ca2+-binding RTX toxin-like protein n=1 Tax=Nitrospirillum iridis TaxID=765888 RepID=A0A7X0B1Z0_9PROT|nr:matrixin family metalloprotease [Nitrospirillum iridis]MBB6253877.1 Ca2+-binding RTX toxin-like protein [Nitrospirillum iridis]